MPPITALLHTENDVRRLGRALETVYPCDDILIVDHGSRDGTVQIARAYGARVVAAEPGASPDHYLRLVRPGWILCLDPSESLTEKLAASLFELKMEWKTEWKTEGTSPPGNTGPAPAFCFPLREETNEGWIEVPHSQTRLVPRTWSRWHARFPIHEPSAVALEGELLRFTFP